MADVPDEGSSAAPVKWASPGEFGQPAATDSRTGVATPLLAGFSIALLAAISQSPASFRWSGPVIFLLVLTVGLFVISLQIGFRSRGKLYSRDEALSWGRINTLAPEQDETLRADIQASHMKIWRQAQRAVHFYYNAGIVALGLALSLTAAPPAGSQQQDWRWAAFALGLALTGLETAWIVRDEGVHRQLQRVVSRQKGGKLPGS
jgi:hypothetical protein